MKPSSFSALANATHPELKESQLFSPIDWLWADFLLGEAQKPSFELGLSALFLSHLQRIGSSHLPINQFAGRPVDPEHSKLAFPKASDWVASLQQAPDIVGKPGDYKPLLLIKSASRTKLYLHRLHTYEQEVAAFVRNMSNRIADPEVRLDGLRLDDNLSDEQRRAIHMGLSRFLTILSGGPGTGKTATLTNLVWASHERSLRSRGQKPNIVVLAPTGKATLRLKQSFASQAKRQHLPKDWLEEVTSNTQTIHTFLRSGGRSSAKQTHLAVVDEFSMVSLQLFCELTARLGDAQYFLAGDKNQLSSIEAATLMKDLTSWDEAKPRKRPHPLQGSTLLLNKSYRFAEGSPISTLSNAINKQDSKQVSKLLSSARSGKGREVRFEPALAPHELHKHIETFLMPHYESFYKSFGQAKTSTIELNKVLGSFHNWGVLCAVKKGLGGAQQLNHSIEQNLVAKGLLRIPQQATPNPSPFYEGRPIMVTENNYPTNLFNGDIGFCVRLEGKEKIIFEGDDEAIVLDPSRLPKHETCYATTVHKAQGSELNNVLFVLPEKPTPLMTKELLYTAISRAKRRLLIVGNKTIFVEAANQQLERHSGLQDMLEGEDR